VLRVSEPGRGSLSAARGSLSAAITNAVVRLHARAYGKGPTRASTRVGDGDYVLCLLRDPFTVSERTLIDAGRATMVTQNREAFYETAERPLRQVVESLVGCPVIAFTAGIATDCDLITQLFVLDPVDSRAQ
jgi:uncharacterized protein YbcI